MTIVSKDRVLLAVAKHAAAGIDAAIEAAAQDLCIPVESVRDAVDIPCNQHQ